jgi:hypothetical protein
MANEERTEMQRLQDEDEPREEFSADGHDDTGPARNPDEAGAFWCRIAQRALERADVLRKRAESAEAELEHAAECSNDYQSRALAAEAELRQLRAAAREAKNGKTDLERALHASVLINMLVGEG